VRVNEWRRGQDQRSNGVDRIKQRFSTRYAKNEVKVYYPSSEVALEVWFQ
jgi:hypothetical protein